MSHTVFLSQACAMAINNILFSGWWWYGLQCIDTLRHDVGMVP